MGAIAQRDSSGTFYRIIDYTICQKSDVERDGYELFITNNPQTGAEVRYFIKRYEGLSGYLTGFQRIDKPDKQIHGWQLELSDADGKYFLSLKDNNSATTRVLKMLRSVNLDKELIIRAWKDTSGERAKTALKFEQGGANVPQYFGNDNLPKPKERPNGKLDFSEAEDVLYADAIKFGSLLANRTSPVTEYTGADPNDPLNQPPDVTQMPPDSNDDIDF